MKYHGLPLLLLVLVCCQPAGKSVKTRGIGVYPGNPAQYTGPELVPGPQATRNLALGRAATHSSSWDYNLTSQLLTDGIVPEGPAPFLESFVNGQPLEKLQREYLNDLSTMGATRPGPEMNCELRFHRYALEVDQVIVSADASLQTVGILEGSPDGEQWVPLGRCTPTRTSNMKGETDLIRHGLEWVYRFPAASYTAFRLSMMGPSRQDIKVDELFFYKAGALVNSLPNCYFSSSWKSLGAKDEWVAVDLGYEARIERMAFHWINGPVSGRIQVSKDGKAWETLREITSADTQVSFPRVKGRYVRALLDATADGKPFELGEWEVIGKGGAVTRAAKASKREGGRQMLSGGQWKLQRASEVSASGEALSTASFDASAWLDATVPGTVLGSFVNAGAVPDPNFADNQLYISDSYFCSDFWYRSVFDAQPDTPRQFLHFNGINWKAQVYLNGRYLGNIDGAFREKDLDVTGILCKGRNCLAVKIEHNKHYGTVKEQDAQTPGQNGGVIGADNPTMHATMGWDWIPTVRGRNTGIYDDVYLSFTGPVTVKDPFVRTELPLPDTTVASLFAQATLENHSAQPVSGVLKGHFGPLSFEKEVSLTPGEKRAVAWDSLSLENPHLWWPAGYGEPYLYDVAFAFETGGAVSDSCRFKSGVRQMDYKLYPYEPLTHSVFAEKNQKQRLDLYVNGRRLTGFGGNWGFPELLLNYRSREYDIAVGYHADMHFNLIRNWVGMTGSRAFYEACDRHGIMIWQDFWLANPWDGPDPYDSEMFNQVALEYVRRIRNHPSLALYVGRNEGYPPQEIDGFLESMVESEHPGMKYIPHSGADGVSGGGPYRALPVKDYFNLFGKDKLHSERGMPTVMNYENLVRTLGERAEPVSTVLHPNALYGLHDYCLGYGENYCAQAAYSFNELLVKAFGEPEDAKEFATLAQWINYDGYRAIFEGRSEHRRGIQLWMSHPAWPSLVWQTYDYFLEPTGAYFGCKKACEPLHILFNPVHGSVEVVNYSAGHRSGLTASACIYDLNGHPVWTRSCPLDIPEDETLSCFPLEVPAAITDVYFIRLKLADAQGKLLSDNFYWQGREEGNLKALRSLPEAEVGVLWYKHRDTLEATFINDGEVPALMLRIKVTDSATGDLVLPVWYSDNYFSLMPGESRTVTVRVREEDCQGTPVCLVEGFNAAEQCLE